VYFRENAERLKEIGLTEDEIRKIKKLRWLLEYCRPEEVFLLKLAYLVKTSRIPKYEVIEGSGEAVKRFEKDLRGMIENFPSECEESVKEYMKENFREFLHIPKERLGICHFKTLADFLLSIRNGSRILYSLVDLRVHIFERKGVFLYSLSMNECGVIRIGRKGRGWSFSGPLLQEYPEKFVKNAGEFAERLFSSEWWEKLSEMAEFIKELPEGEYSRKLEKLNEAKEWFELLRELDPALRKIRKVPFTFVSQTIAYHIYLLEEYLKM